MSGSGPPHVGLLAAPLPMRGQVARNRVWHAPMSVCYAAPDGTVTDAEIAHYGRRADGGAGVVIVENAAVSVSGRQLPRQTMASEERHGAGLARLAAAIHDGGALAVLQLVHAGRYAGPWDAYEARRRLAPSAVEFPLTPGRTVVPQEITEAEIADVIADFGRAAALAQRAGFDGVEIHGAQGFLLTQFLSPRTNRRTDRWGGPFAHRARLALEVVTAVRTATTDRFLVGFHLLAQELLPGGVDLAEATALAVALEKAGTDFLIPVTATFEDLHGRREHMARPGFQLDQAAAVAAAVTIPVVANGGLGDPAAAAAALAGTGLAVVGLARPLLVDPDWPNKVLGGRAADVRTCPCDPPQCIRTQLDGVTCHHWPATATARGFLGRPD